MGYPLLPMIAVTPLAVAALTVLVRRPWIDRLAMFGVPLATMLAGLWLLRLHREEPVIAHYIGGFEPAVSIGFASDTMTAFMLVVTGLALAVSATYLIFTREDRLRFLPALLMMLTCGVNGAILTADIFNLFVWIEVMLLPSYALIAITGSWARLQVGRTFILVNLLTSTLLLMGVGTVYAVAGTVNLGALAGVMTDDPRAAMAVGLVLLALAIKAGLVPAHGWLPQTYPGTSAGIMSVFAAVHTKVALYAIYRIYVVTSGGAPAAWSGWLPALAAVTILVGAIATFGVSRLRAAMAWQMISGVGHILIGPVLMTAAGLGAGLFYLGHHVISVGALLLVAGAIEHTYGTTRFDRLSGLMRREPWAAWLLGLGLFSLVGLPPTSGLWGKVGLIATTAAADLTTGTAVVLLGALVLASIISLMALQRFWTMVLWGPPMETYRPDDVLTGRAKAVPLPDDVRIPARLLVPSTVLIALSVLIFLVPGPVTAVTDLAGAQLIDVTGYREAVLP